MWGTDKGKVVTVLILLLFHEDVWGKGGMSPPLLTSALDGGEWSASSLDLFTPGEGIPVTYWIGGRHANVL
jgi:hypothetical protein